MADITAAQVKELRECTGAGMMECKKALVETAGDLDASIDLLRTRGLAAIAKKAGRATNEGLIVAYISDSEKVGALLEVNCETDFVARNEKFAELAATLVKTVAMSAPADVEALMAAQAADSDLDIEGVLSEAVNVLGENIQVSRFTRREVGDNGELASYIHGGGRIGVLVELESNGIDQDSEIFDALGRDVAMQVAASAPLFCTREDADPAEIEHEMSIYRQQAAESGKPEAIQQKMAEGRLEKYYKECTLVEQEFIKDMDLTVQGHVDSVAKELGGQITVVGFDRYVVGEGA